MYWKDKAVLIGEDLVMDGDGYKSVRETRRTVYANQRSAARSEFYTAKQAGDRIVLALDVRGADYRGETRLEFGGRPYEVVRAYTRDGEVFELNCKEAAQRAADGGEAGEP